MIEYSVSLCYYQAKGNLWEVLMEPILSSSKADGIADYDKNFRASWKRIFTEYRQENVGDRMWLAGPSSSVFSLAGERFAVDLQIRRPQDLEALLPGLAEDTSALSHILVTHEHDDHLCLPLMQALKDMPIRWYLPYNSHREWVEATGISMDKITWLEPGDCFSIGKLRVRSFNTPHAKPGIPIFTQCGYEITAPSGKILLPGDIRDYEYDAYPDFGKVDLCISHLWAGDDSIHPEQYLPLMKQFTERIAGFHADRYFLCHLYEIARDEQHLWDFSHAGTAMQMLYHTLPECEVQIPRIGRSYPFSF